MKTWRRARCMGPTNYFFFAFVVVFLDFVTFLAFAALGLPAFIAAAFLPLVALTLAAAFFLVAFAFFFGALLAAPTPLSVEKGILPAKQSSFALSICLSDIFFTRVINDQRLPSGSSTEAERSPQYMVSGSDTTLAPALTACVNALSQSGTVNHRDTGELPSALWPFLSPMAGATKKRPFLCGKASSACTGTELPGIGNSRATLAPKAFL
mmetsp:Transcript_749/g.2605  ORF Transcript_749/g.2605 Transcript_749/m.2605 type:complete len:210 (+) Transcript_749:124-753(+)